MLIKPLQLLCAGAVAAVLGGCPFQDRIESFGGPTMGSTYTIKYVRAGGTPKAERLQEEVESILREVDGQMSTYRSDSLIGEFNEAPAGCREMPEGVLALVRYGEQLSRQSGGAFDLTLEPLLNLWGFGPQGRGLQVPDAEALAEVRSRYGYRHLSVQGEQLCKDIDGLQVEFNSIAAGHAVDRIGERLEQLGVHSYVVEATGELKAVGRKPNGDPWRIGIEAPQSDQRVAQRILELDGLGISTSGDYRNHFEEGGQLYSHTFDPRAAAPVDHALAAVTVVDPSAMHADGLSTLLMVLGPEDGYAFAKARRIPAFFVSKGDDGFVIRSTPAFDALFPAQGEAQ